MMMGVIVIPESKIPSVLEASQARLRKEIELVEHLKNKETTIELLGLEQVIAELKLTEINQTYQEWRDHVSESTD